MKTYLLFLYPNFETHEEIEFFCLEVFASSPLIDKVRFVIEDSSKSIIIIFESKSARKELSEELQNIISMEDIKFYFLFDRESIHSANIPIELKDFIFKPNPEHSSIKLDYNKEKNEEKSVDFMDLDSILEKIDQYGLESLSEDEKKFLDEFQN